MGKDVVRHAMGCNIMESLGVVILILSLNYDTKNAANAGERRRGELSKAIQKGRKKENFHSN